MQLKSFFIPFQKLLESFLDFVFPPYCLICKNHIPVAKEFVCTTCWEALEPIPNPFCPLCKNFLVDGNSCENCNPNNLWVFSLGPFDDCYQELIHQFKYKAKLSLGRILSSRLGDLLISKSKDRNLDCIIPVPLHSSRQRQRGFNQSHIIAETLGEKLSLPVERKILKRKKKTKDQTRLSPEERKANVREAFQIVYSEKVKNKNILLVDDVVTTGATLEECARELRKSGARSVCAATLCVAVLKS